MDARAVVLEAYAVEREAGGWPFAGVTFDDLRQAVQDLSELCAALQAQDLDDEQQQVLANVAATTDALIAEIDGGSPDVPTIEGDVVEAAQGLKELCNTLRTDDPDEDWGFLDSELFPALNNLIDNVSGREKSQSIGKPAPSSAPETRPRGDKK